MILISKFVKIGFNKIRKVGGPAEKVEIFELRFNNLEGFRFNIPLYLFLFDFKHFLDYI